jgi:hypothetical protein
MVARAKEIDRKFPAVLGDFLSLGDLGWSVFRRWPRFASEVIRFPRQPAVGRS